MLYQPQPHASPAMRLFQIALAILAAGLASLSKGHGDLMYLDGMRRDELEELGLRRTQDGGYRPSGD
jgi:hypothetical protein